MRSTRIVRSMIAAVVLTLVLTLVSTTAASAQVRDTGIKTNTDWVLALDHGTVQLAGWAFNCTTQGQQPFSARLYYVSQTNPAIQGYATEDWRKSALRRDDVAAAFNDCGGPLNPYTGFLIQFSGIPAGDMRLHLEWTDSLNVRYTTRYLTVKP